jgi:hypothetical protein
MKEIQAREYFAGARGEQRVHGTAVLSRDEAAIFRQGHVRDWKAHTGGDGGGCASKTHAPNKKQDAAFPSHSIQGGALPRSGQTDRIPTIRSATPCFMYLAMYVT